MKKKIICGELTQETERSRWKGLKAILVFNLWLYINQCVYRICMCTHEHGYRSCNICLAAAAAAKSFQSCPTPCDPIDGSPPGSPVPGILQARTLEWAAISFSNAWKWKVKVKLLSHVRLSDPMDCSLPGSSIHGIFRQEYWSWVPLPSPNICFGFIL